MIAAVSNSLLRLDGASGKLPPPFACPNEKMELHVLELGEHQRVEDWCRYILQTIQSHREVLRSQIEAGATATLFVECTSSVPVLRLEAQFLAALGDAGIALEYYCAQEG